MNVLLSAKQIEMHDYHGHDPSDDVSTAEPEHGASSSADRASLSSADGENGGLPHGEVGASATELARNLPELVEHLRRLRLEMEKCNKIYEAINLSQRASGKISPDELPGGGDDHGSLYQHAELFGHEDSFSSKMSGSSLDGMPEDYDAINYGPPVGTNRNSIAVRRSQQQMTTPAHRSSLRMSTKMQQSVSYSVMWVSGECGISLRNFSSNKVGAQIAVLQQADGVTTGISNCRLGDQLICVNDDQVEDMKFKDIVQKLKSTRRPIALGFRTNQNVQTSPTAASSANRSTMGSMSRTNSSRGFFSSNGGVSADYEDYVNSSYAMSSALTASTDSALDRPTYSSMRSSTSTLSDDVEIFCKEQEEMHSDIIVVLTETVMRCEKLQQQNLDQMQSLMQLAPNLQATTSVPTSQESVMAMSSLAPVSSPAEAVKLRSSMNDASTQNGSFHSAVAPLSRASTTSA